MMTEETKKQEVPETISMTEADVDRASLRAVLKAGWMHLMINSVKKDVTGTGKLRITAYCVPIGEDGTAASKATAKLDLYPPVTNPKNPTAEVAKPKGCYFFARSVDKNFPSYAKKQSVGKYTTKDGEVVDMSGAKAIERDVNRAVAQKSVEWYNDPTILMNETFYGCVEHETGPDGTIYPKVKWTRMEAPEEPLITKDFIQR
jgi:hypothetical protein